MSRMPLPEPTLIAMAPEVALAGEVEINEVYVVAGHKGQPAAVAKRGGSGARACKLLGGDQAAAAVGLWSSFAGRKP
jgi:hypothetical protein